MKRSIILLALFASSAFADMAIIPMTGNNAFDYFGSLYIWLTIYSMPFIIAFGFLVNLKNKF